jgi:hypothetical protein
MAESSASGESSSSKSLLWMMIALFVGLGGLLGGGLFMANRMVGSVGLAAATSKDIIRTPAGNLHLEKQNDVGPGLPVYSNASLVLPSDKSAAIAIQERNSGIASVTYHTRDTRDSVDLWYSKHLSAEFARHDAGESPLPEVLRDGRVSQSDISFLAQRGRQVRIVSLSLDTTGGTFISLVRFDKSPGQ